MLNIPPRTPALDRPRPTLPCDEAGFTLVELMVAMVISITLLTLMATMVVVYTRAQATTVNSANAAASTRLALLSLEHDIQSANPVATLSSVSAYKDQLQLTIKPSNQLITWKYNFNSGQATCVPATPSQCTLTRQIGSAPVAVVLSNVTDGDPASGGVAAFSYYDHCSINLVNEPQSTPALISADVTAVQINLSLSNSNTAPYGSTTTVRIMNQPPGSNRCG